MKKFIIFNWKMAPTSLKEAGQLFDSIPKEIKNLKIVVAPPFVYLSFFNIRKFDFQRINVNTGRSNFQNIKLAAQNCFYESRGAYTGEISPTMIKNLGVEYVIVGHSERRRILGETDEMINKKILAALKAGLKVILCVGEPTRTPARELRIKNAELRKAKNYVKRQLLKDLKGVLNLKSEILNLIVAYEPIWAIGTGRSDTPQDACDMIQFIKEILTKKYKIRIPKVIYGGSVNSKNIRNFVKYKEIDGVLVGGVSLKKEEIKKIIKTCQTIM